MGPKNNGCVSHSMSEKPPANVGRMSSHAFAKERLIDSRAISLLHFLHSETHGSHCTKETSIPINVHTNMGFWL